MTITFAPRKLATTQGALQKTGQAQCLRIVMMPYFLMFKDKFQESETIQVITGLDCSMTAAISFQRTANLPFQQKIGDEALITRLMPFRPLFPCVL